MMTSSREICKMETSDKLIMTLASYRRRPRSKTNQNLNIVRSFIAYFEFFV